MKNIIEKCRTTRILAIIGIVGLFLGVILPYVRMDLFIYEYTIALWEYWEGKVIMVLVIANLLFIFKDFIEKFVPALFNSSIGQKIKNCKNPKLSLIPTILVAIFAIYLTATLGIDSFKYYSIGFYLMWIGTISLVAYAFLHKNENIQNENIQSGNIQNGNMQNGNMQNGNMQNENMQNGNMQNGNMQNENIQKPL